MKISIIGYYGANFGDLLMLNVLLSIFVKKYAVINVFSYGDVVTLEKVLTVNKGFSKYRIFSLVGPDASKYFLENVKGSTSLNWGGGTCFMDEGGTGGLKFMLLAKTIGVTINYLGIGIDKHSKLKTKMYIAMANLISSKLYFRDQVSKSVADRLSPFGKDKNLIVPDLAYGHEDGASNLIGETYILFCTRNLSRYSTSANATEGLVKLTIAIAHRLGVRKIANLICDSEIDLAEAEKARELFLKDGFIVQAVNGYDLKTTIDHIANASFVLSVRLHPAVLANSLKVPFAIFNYSDKNLKFVEDVNETSRLIAINKISEHVVVYSAPKNTIGADNKCRVLSMLSKL
jgi:polysaccharide pyruvyl transferase WcaK-like protein